MLHQKMTMWIFSIFAISLVVLLLWSEPVHCFNIPILSATLKVAPSEVSAVPTKSVVTKVVVAGATGRTGRLVVQQLLENGVPNVVALVRDTKKASEIFPNPPKNLEIIQCDLGSEAQVSSKVDGCDAAIWCATGFTDGPNVDPFEKLKRFIGLAVAPQRSIDVVGLPAIAKVLANAKNQPKVNGSGASTYPKLVMCSSAGVTRPGWDKNKKAKYVGAADIPIVRLNPFNILERKLESEEKLRKSGIDYCILRPCGLNDNWPAGSRPVFTQGDVAVGRNNRSDLARVLVDILSTPEATGKTFEMVCIAGYPPAQSLGPILSRLKTDAEEPIPSPETVEASYAIMQQLLPGEQQDSAALAMGQTYEQLDQGKVGRLGERGKENLSVVPLTPSS